MDTIARKDKEIERLKKDNIALQQLLDATRRARDEIKASRDECREKLEMLSRGAPTPSSNLPPPPRAAPPPSVPPPASKRTRLTDLLPSEKELSTAPPPPPPSNKSIPTILVPYRAGTDQPRRKQQLDTLMNYFQTNHPTWNVLVIEQNDERPFNRGALLNIGAKLAKERFHSSYVIFHDVDFIPTANSIQYYTTFPTNPIHIGHLYPNKYNSTGSNTSFIGQVFSISMTLLERINGFPNNFWGWGGEDDVMYRRLAIEDPAQTILRPKVTFSTTMAGTAMQRDLIHQDDGQARDKLYDEPRKVEKKEEDKLWYTAAKSGQGRKPFGLQEAQYTGAAQRIDMSPTMSIYKISIDSSLRVVYTSQQRATAALLALRSSSRGAAWTFPSTTDAFEDLQTIRRVLQYSGYIPDNKLSVISGTITPELKTADGYVWSFKGDFLPTGGIPSQIPDSITIYGLPIDPMVVNSSLIADLQPSRILYHGGTQRAFKEIMATGFEESRDGQFGCGVYLGSYWKAKRFALASSDYKQLHPDPVIMRVRLIDPSFTNAADLPRTAEALQQWRRVSTSKTLYAPTMEKPGTTQFLVRNPEWCTSKDNVVLLDAVKLFAVDRYIHDPYDRTTVNALVPPPPPPPEDD